MHFSFPTPQYFPIIVGRSVKYQVEGVMLGERHFEGAEANSVFDLRTHSLHRHPAPTLPRKSSSSMAGGYHTICMNIYSCSDNHCNAAMLYISLVRGGVKKRISHS